jgi:hypothetical protein
MTMRGRHNVNLEKKIMKIVPLSSNLKIIDLKQLVWRFYALNQNYNFSGPVTTCEKYKPQVQSKTPDPNSELEMWTGGFQV